MDNGEGNHRINMGAGKANLTLSALSPELFVFEVHKVSPETRELIAMFPCTFEELNWILDNGGSFQSTTPAGSLSAMAGTDELWIAYQINQPPIEESCVLPLEEFREKYSRCRASIGARLM